MKYAQLAAILACLMALTTMTTDAQDSPSTFAPDLTELCSASPQHPPKEWQVSRALDRDLWASRFSCLTDTSGERVLRITVHPGDAADPNPGGNPTERVEIQVRRQIVKFDEPVWYQFRFRLISPWLGIGNRTVIHQVKQDIQPGKEAPRGVCPSANPLFKIEARATTTGAAFLVKTQGMVGCLEKSGQKTICGPWPIDVETWHQVHVLLQPSQRDGASDVRVWLDGRGCAPYSGRLGYVEDGIRDDTGRPVINAQPRFGIYRDALPNVTQSIDFADLMFWQSDPSR